MPRSRPIAIAVTALAAAFCFAACGDDDDSPAEPAAAKEPVKITVGLGYWAGNAPLYVAEGLNLDENYGIDLETKLLATTESKTAAWSSGDLDSTMDLPDNVGPLMRARPSKTIAVTNKSDGADKLVGTVASIKDLPGHKFAFKTSDYTASFVIPALEKAGVELDDIELVPLDYNDGPPALAAGKVDAAASYEPLVTNALKNTKGVNVLASTKDNDTILESLILTEELAENPKAVEGLLRTYQAGVEALRNDPEKAVPIAAKAQETGLKDYEISLDGVQLYDLQESEELLESGKYVERMRAYLDVLESVGNIDDAASLGDMIEESVDPSYAATVLKEEG